MNLQQFYSIWDKLIKKHVTYIQRTELRKNAIKIYLSYGGEILLSLIEKNSFYARTVFFTVTHKTDRKDDFTLIGKTDLILKITNKLESKINKILPIEDENLLNEDDFVIDNVRNFINPITLEKSVEIIIRINRICNQNCSFCFIDLNNSMYSKVLILNELTRVLNSLDQNNRNIYLKISGGEPTLHLNFWNIIDNIYNIATKKGNVFIEIQTNAIKFAQDDFVNQLKKRAYLAFFISFHSHEEKFYNKITNTKKQFNLAITGIKNILKYTSQLTVINIVCNIYNIEKIKEYCQFILDNFAIINKVKINFSTLNIVEYNYQCIDLLVNFSKLREKIKNTKLFFENKNILFNSDSGSFCDIPFCIEKTNEIEIENLLCDYDKNKFNDRAKLETCKLCIFNNNCPGISQIYLQKFGENEFKAVIKKNILK